ncbi:MAG: alpha/beta hydrolase [Verrucomicrobiota bacterium]
MPQIEIDRYRVSYETRGEGRNLVFLHGLGADRRQALAATRNLTEVKVVCIDMPGHFESDGEHYEKAGGSYAFEAFGDLVLGVMDRLGMGSAVLGGISMGAGISLNLALRAPERLEGLVLARPAWLDTEGLPQLRVVRDMGEWILSGGVSNAVEKLNSDVLYATQLETNPNCASSIAGALTRPQALEAARVLIDMVEDAPVDSLKRLEGLEIPAIVIGSEGDPLHPVDIAEKIGALLPLGHFEELPPRYFEAERHQAAFDEIVGKFLIGLNREKATT